MSSEAVRPYLPRLTVDWAREHPDQRWMAVDASLAFVDISGFTKMSERLARHGKVGAEEVAGGIGQCFEALLAVAYAAGGSLLKFGGDALLLLFTDDAHEERAALCAVGMQRRLAEVGRLDTTAGRVVLRMSAGVHSGRVHCFLAGHSHRELILCGETVSKVVEMEGAATAGQVIVSPATAAGLPATLLGPETGPGVRLRRVATPPPDLPVPTVSADGLDLGTYLSTEIRAHTLAGSLDAQHRQATVAFLHFDGTDALLASEGAGVTADALDELVTNVQEAADTHSVTFLASDIDHDGGKLVLVAGAPRATGDDEVRMLTTLRRIADTPGKLALRIGVNRGAVFAGDVGPSYRRTYTTMGDTVNLAARLMAKAEPGQVLASTTVVDRAGARFQTEPAGPFDMKGVRDPVPAFAIGATRRRLDVASTTLPLVGRDAEITAFSADLEAVRAGEGRVIELVGEPGIGKSRLTNELRELGADLPGITVTCEAYDATTPYAPFWWLLHDLLLLTQDASPEMVEGKLRQVVAELSPELEPLLPLLGTPLDLDLPETSETASLAPEFRATRVQEATALFLDRILPNPVLLVLEDVHWIDEASRGVLDLVIHGLRRRPALLCMTRRDTERAYTAPELDHVRTLRPAPLTRAECREALLGATEDSPMAAHAVGVLAERAGGNPLFLGELLSAAAQGGDVDALPDSVDAVVTAQIDRLPPDRRRLLRVASVLGRAFSLADLTAILDPGLEPPDAAAWEDLSGFLTFDGPGALRFKHALLRDTAYEELPFRVRKDLHGRAGAALAASLGDHADSEAELLSMHFFYAHLFADAWHYARIAGTRASAKYANHEAAELLERALAAVRRVADAPSLEVAAVWETLGDVRERAGMFEPALAAYRGARRLRKGDALGQASLLLKESWIAERDGRYSQSVRLARRCRRALDDTDADGAAALRAHAEGWEATVRQAQGRSEDAVAGCLRAIEDAQRAGAKEAEAHARFILDWAYVELGRPELAVHSARALEIYEELGNLDGQAVVINNLGGFAYFEGRWDDALELYERGRERRTRSGNIIEAETGTLNIGEILADRGLDDEAERCFRTAQRAWKAAAYPAGVALTEMHLARIAARRGHFDEAFAGFARARQEFAAIEAHSDVLEVDTRTAECHLLRADPDAALALATDGLRAARAEGGGQLAALQRIRGLALFAHGSFTEAAVALEESLSEAQARGAIFDVALTLDALAELAAQQHDDEAARRSRDESAALFEKLGVRDPSVVGAAARISADRSADLRRATGSRT